MQVFIPAAGLGLRTRALNLDLPKPLLSVGMKPLIGRVMMLYPEETNFVIALGYKSEWVRQVVEAVAKENNQKVKIFYTESWKNNGQGLSHTIYEAKEYLKAEFIFHAVDSLIPPEICNQLLTSKCNSIVLGKPISEEYYRYPKGPTWAKDKINPAGTTLVYTGVSAIHKTHEFWKFLEDKKEIAPESGETLGLNPENCEVIQIESNEWLDCGNTSGLEKTRQIFPTEEIILERKNEAIWHIGKQMYKFHTDENFILQRIKRSISLQPFVPLAKFVSNNIYSYDRVPGISLSKSNEEVFQDFLNFCLNFWFKIPETTSYPQINFDKFYRKKTLERIHSFLQKYPNYRIQTINGNKVELIQDLLVQIPWDSLTDIHWARSHGDLHPDNVVYNQKTKTFSLLDWRQDFDGSTSQFGDLYYELAKINHGLIVDHEIVSKNGFYIDWRGDEAICDIESGHEKEAWKKIFKSFCAGNSFNINKLEIMTSLIYLNIAILHHENYDKFLFTLGHKMLCDALKKIR